MARFVMFTLALTLNAVVASVRRSAIFFKAGELWDSEMYTRSRFLSSLTRSAPVCLSVSASTLNVYAGAIARTA